MRLLVRGNLPHDERIGDGFWQVDSRVAVGFWQGHTKAQKSYEQTQHVIES